MKIKIEKVGTLIEILKKYFDTSSLTNIKKLIKNECIKVNGEIAKKPTLSVSPKDTIEYNKHQSQNEKVIPFKLYFEDEHYIIIEKPPGILTISTEKEKEKTIVYLMRDFLDEKLGKKSQLHAVHRLDKEVSGLLILGKNLASTEALQENWKSVEKRYVCLVKGEPPEDMGVLTSWLKENSIHKVYVDKESPHSKKAVTEYKVFKRYKNASLLELIIQTGRKNQIRVQMTEIGCPIIGDKKYGLKHNAMGRIGLHAFSIKFEHPFTGKTLHFTSPIPTKFKTIGDNF